MHWLKSNWKNFIIPGLIIFLLGISYAVQAGKLGWYLDDWIILEAYSMGGPARLGAYTYMGGRPLVSPLWLSGFWVCGYNATLWQIWALTWRALTSLFLWLGLRRLFPKNDIAVGLSILLFTVYPLFDQQASALTFSFHWISFALWALSFYFMILAAKNTRFWTILTLSGLLFFMTQIFSNEFFVGLELLRPVTLWWIFRTGPKPIRKTIQHEMPWMITFIGYLIWRLLLMPTPPTGDRNSPIMIVNLLKEPLTTAIDLISMVGQTLLESIGGVWHQAIEPSTFVIGTNADFLSWVIVVFLLSIVILFVWHFVDFFQKDSHEIEAFFWIFSFLFFLAGIAPGLLKGSYYKTTVNYSDRFAMAAMPGASLIITSAVWTFFRSQKVKIIFLSLLILLSVGFQFRLANQYRQSWQKQQRMYWQLLWRAPQVAEKTGFLGNGPIVLGLGNWATSSAINLMYGNYNNPAYVPYWYVDLYRINIDDNNNILDFRSAHLNFQWKKSQSVVFQYETDVSPCLWVLDKEDIHNPQLDRVVLEALPLSDLSRISFERTLPIPVLFGEELDHDWWCYYYQKGDAAAQRGDWETVLDLYLLAQLNDQRPYASSEYTPFIQAAVEQGDWQLAEDMTLHASYLTNSNDQICEAWQSSSNSKAIPPDVQSRLIESFRCTNLLEE